MLADNGETDLCSEQEAAVRIQSSYRGYQTRKNLKNDQKHQLEEIPEQPPIDVDLNDPDVESAATKIQAGFRGHKTRKE